MAAKKPAKVAPKEERQFAHPKDHAKCINCTVWLPMGTDVCPNCGYHQPHPS